MSTPWLPGYEGEQSTSPSGIEPQPSQTVISSDQIKTKLIVEGHDSADSGDMGAPVSASFSPPQYSNGSAVAATASPNYQPPPLNDPPPVYEYQSSAPADYSQSASLLSQPQILLPGPPPPSFPPPQYSSPDALPAAKIQYKITSHGVTSLDPQLLTHERITQFFQEHSGKPGMRMDIWGHHTEYYTTHSTDSNGNRHTQTHSRVVTDFRYGFDLTSFVNPAGTIIAPQAAIDAYFQSKNYLREVKMKKIVIWDYVTLTQLVRSRIRQLGYPYTISVSYPLTYDVIKVEDSGDCSRCCHSTWTKVFCWITCLCVFWYPLRWCYADIKQISCQFNMLIDPVAYYNSIALFLHR